MRIITTILDVVFPPRANEKLLRKVASLPSVPNYHLDTIYLSSFEVPVVSATIVEHKFHRNRKAERLLTNLLENWLAKQTSSLVLIPVPLSQQRLKERGYNQVSEIIKNIKLPNVVVLENVVERIKDIPPQTSLSKTERLKNVQGAFAVADTKSLKTLDGQTVVIIDDVVTTGATLKAVRASLAPHLPTSTKLLTLALAH